MPPVTIVDFGAGNLHSVARAFEKIGTEVRLVATGTAIEGADRLVLPGVGAFAACMSALRARGLDEAVVRFARTGNPLLGICVGMQMLFNGSDEFGQSKGLSLLPGWVRAIPAQGDGRQARKVPHVGWSDLRPVGDRGGSGALLMAGFNTMPTVYFLHSFIAYPAASGDEIACADHDGLTFTAAVARDNVIGCQFHPEKSGPAGLAILSNFARMR